MVALVFTHHCHLRHLFTIHPGSDEEVVAKHIHIKEGYYQIKVI